MAGPICKVWLAKPGEAFYALSDAERDAAFAQDQAAVQATGGRTVLACDSAWSNEHWPNWGVEWYPSLDAHVQFVESQKQVNWWQYMGRSRAMLGSPFGEVAEYTPLGGEVCKLWMARPLPAGTQ